MRLINALQQRAQTNPKDVAIIQGDKIISYGQLWQLVMQTAHYLQQHNVDRLAVALNNTLAWVLVDLSAQLNHIVIVPIPSFFTEHQKKHAIHESGCQFLIGDSSFVENKTLKETNILLNESLFKINNVISALPPQTAKITFTSGSTGEPKGVCLSQALIDDVSEQLASKLISQHIKRHVILLPLSILLENIAGIYVPLLLGATLILPKQDGSSVMTLKELHDALIDYEPNSLLLTAEGLRGLVLIAQENPHVVSSLTYVAVGGSVLSPALIQQARDNNIPVYQGYGLSECGSVVAVNTPADDCVTSVGKILDNVHITIAKDGEIIVERNNLLGYVGNLNPPLFINTGDIGYVDDDGFLYVTGRKKNVCITSYGRNFSPEWVESQAQCYPSIQHLIIFGDGKPFNVAVIQSRTEYVEKIASDVAQLNSQLPDYAQIAYYVIATEPFTSTNGLLTSNGRPKRHRIYQHYEKQIDYQYNIGKRA
jgi:long-chain acyl-CoA synthetase